MSNFSNHHVHCTARVPHRYSYCAEPIRPGDRYVHQTGHWDGSWFDSKMHPECWDDLCENGDGEYIPYSNDRPKATETESELRKE